MLFSDFKGLGSSGSRGKALQLCSWPSHFALKVPLSTQAYKCNNGYRHAIELWCTGQVWRTLNKLELVEEITCSSSYASLVLSKLSAFDRTR